ISLPNALHHPWTMRSLAAGKHVLCEKPYTRHPAEVDEAFDFADRAGLVLSEAFMWRHHPQADRLAGLVPELGALQAIRSSFSYVIADRPDVRLAADLDGGALMDVGCYCLSGARLLAGEEPDLVYGSATTGPSGVDLRFDGILHFPSGVVATFSTGFTAPHRSLEAIGSAGSASLVDPWHADPAIVVHDGIETALEPADAYQLELDDVSAAIRGRTTVRLGRADALGQARTIEALYRSAASGLPVRL
ncbi:MAG TPA: Gfo/Idh/MocA family oxidoreductase, partial [Patescibacteria group bacterium]|nr:Gfo/Idh/MocA family oxidoreductase [Patescibacteria group bacterium]